MRSIPATSPSDVAGPATSPTVPVAAAEALSLRPATPVPGEGKGAAGPRRLRAALVAGCLATSILDGALTVRHAARFGELNPLLRALLESPASFLLAKATFTTVAILCFVARGPAERSRLWLAAMLCAYVAIVVQWLLLARR